MQPTALVPWIWNLGLTGAEIWIYHRLEHDDPRLTAAVATLAAFEPYPCNSTVRLQRLLPNKGREAAVYMAHIVRHYNHLPEGLVLVHDHGPAARHSLCGPFFRRVRGYYAGIREQLQGANGSIGGLASTAEDATAAAVVTAGGGGGMDHADGSATSSSSASIAATGDGGGGGWDGGSEGLTRRRVALDRPWRKIGRGRLIGRTIASAPVRQMLAQFADMVVSLSSGCQENWLKGCCALLVCAEDGDHPSVGHLPAATEAKTTTSSDADGLSAGAMEASTDDAAAATIGAGAVADIAQATDRALLAAGPRRSQRDLLQDGEEEGSLKVVPELAAYGDGTTATGPDGRLLTEAEAEAARSARARCPFKTSRCIANASAMGVPLRGGMGRGATRWVYMHGAGGLYDTRYENLVVLYDETPEAAAVATGLANAGFGPLSLLRYAGPGTLETARLQTSSSRDLDYPEGSSERTPQETFAHLAQILQAHDFATQKAPGNFKSCCASLMLRPRHVRRWPRSMYEQMLSYTLDTRNTYHASLAVSHHGWSMWAGADVGPADLLRYFEVDLALLRIRGCPGWRMVEE